MEVIGGRVAVKWRSAGGFWRSDGGKWRFGGSVLAVRWLGLAAFGGRPSEQYAMILVTYRFRASFLAVDIANRTIPNVDLPT